MYPGKRKNKRKDLLRKYYLSTEGSLTEPVYFDRLKKVFWDTAAIEVFFDRDHASPEAVLQRLRDKTKAKSLRAGDELWCVIDRDDWREDVLGNVAGWRGQDNGIKRDVALSNPKFELWLLAHFEDLPATIGSGECVRKLKAHMPEYKKEPDVEKITRDAVMNAIGRAMASCPDGAPPDGKTGTNVWVLVASMARKE